MINADFAKIFEQISEILELKNADSFRVLAYQKAAREIDHLGEDLDDVYKKGGLKALKDLPGIGESVALKIEELIKTGKCREYEQLKKKTPKVLLELLQVPGIGAKTARKLYRALKLKSLKDLERAVLAGEVSRLPGFRAKTEANIAKALQSLRRRQKETRHLLSVAEAIAQEIISYLKESPAVERIDAVGSLRRMRETIGDVDLIVGSKQPEKVVAYFCKFPGAKQVLSRGDTKGAILHKKMVRVDLEVLPLETYGSLLQHFTGSKEHNVELRTWAKVHGYSISEYGVKVEKTGQVKKCRDEAVLYKFLKMDCPPPEIREARGEIQAALKHNLPQLIGYRSIKGDLHCHSEASGDATGSLENLAVAAQKLGYEYLAITEHTSSLGIAQGLTGAQLLKHQKKISAVNRKIKGIKLLAGVEAEIKADGSIDIPNEVLKQLDIVVASVHSAFHQSEAVMTSRLLRAIANPAVDIIGHPSGRLLLKRDPYDVEWSEVFKAASRRGVALEINAYPERLDLNDTLVHEALKYGVKFVVSADSHDSSQLPNMRYGIATARRGWATAGDVINTWPLTKLLKWCGEKGKLIK